MTRRVNCTGPVAATCNNSANRGCYDIAMDCTSPFVRISAVSLCHVVAAHTVASGSWGKGAQARLLVQHVWHCVQGNARKQFWLQVVQVLDGTRVKSCTLQTLTILKDTEACRREQGSRAPSLQADMLPHAPAHLWCSIPKSIAAYAASGKRRAHCQVVIILSDTS